MTHLTLSVQQAEEKVLARMRFPQVSEYALTKAAEKDREAVDALIAAVRAEGAAQIAPHDCEAWAMEGIGCANCNPASPQAWQARAETAEAKLTEAGHRTLEQGERLMEWRNRAEAAEAENQRLRAQLAQAQP